ncbi:MAG: phosphatase PAP2 family protein [Candidatus Nealsonbacteria bacterium]|nr:phosphatase PAP2 family protein [Candidatus Nealsonbacteria bacterium]
MDYFLFQKINNLAGQYAWLDNLAVFSAKYLGYILVALIILLFYLPAGRQVNKWKIIFQAFLASFIARFAVVELIRWLWPRPRPFIENHINLLIDKVNQASFPSGHAAFFFALSFVVYKYNKKAGIWVFIASFLISIARVFAGVHWPSDILAGAIVGVISGWLTIIFLQRFFSIAKKSQPL